MPDSPKGIKPAGDDANESEQRTVRLLLVDEAHVVARGEALRVWFVKLGQGWIKACEHPATIAPDESESDGLPPGTVWRRTTEIAVPLGTLIMSRSTAPHVVRLDPLSYLVRGKVATNRKVAETFYRVTGNYRIEVVRDGSV